MNGTNSNSAEKRLADRSDLSPALECSVLDPETGQRWTALLQDISLSGLSLVVNSKVCAGRRLVAEIANRETGVRQFVGLAVRHSDKSMSAKSWLLGCSLEQQLTAEEVGYFNDRPIPG